ncbi:hypothetical protein NQ318_003186 [Aromia moschata]|uniref:Integrase p58-like C-terminal domain-containing protein n=1 Tax=Aromia moschata TaxID=1265417 RepID=A0AAV8YGU7_9CUCU|nr:hypothetical protein NQ318_003186 [Aromia moschata]
MTTTVQVEDEWSSAEIMKSQKKDNDLRLIWNWVKNGVRPTWQEVSRYEFVEDLRERMDRIHRFAREKLKIHSDKMKQRLDTTSTETAFKPGDAVWLYAPKRTKGKSPKLQSNWKGPYTIIKKINDLVYRIQLSPRSKPKVVHLERLARYTGHNPPDWFVVEDPPPRTEDSVIRDE